MYVLQYNIYLYLSNQISNGTPSIAINYEEHDWYTEKSVIATDNLDT